jgi:hypothetical protein
MIPAQTNCCVGGCNAEGRPKSVIGQQLNRCPQVVARKLRELGYPQGPSLSGRSLTEQDRRKSESVKKPHGGDTKLYDRPVAVGRNEPRA